MGIKTQNYDLLTMSAQNGGWVRYQNFPAEMYGHHVNGVRHFVEVNIKEPLLDIPSEQFHCVDCKLIGVIKTMKDYKCL